jgi:hypothetical protein
MYASDEFVCITTGTGSDTQVTIVVVTSIDTRLIGNSDSPCPIVLPKGFGADMAT